MCRRNGVNGEGGPCLKGSPRTIERTDDVATKRTVEYPPGQETSRRNRLPQDRGRNESQGFDRERIEAQARSAAAKREAGQLHHRHRGEVVQELLLRFHDLRLPRSERSLAHVRVDVCPDGTSP